MAEVIALARGARFVAKTAFKAVKFVAGTGVRGVRYMARKRKSYRGRARFGRRRFKRRRGRMRSRYRIFSEKKLHNENVTFLPGVDSATAHHMTGIAQGVDNINRIGDKIAVTSISWRISMKMDTGSSNSHDEVRLAWVVDRQQQAGASPAVSSIYENAFNPLGYLSPNSFGRFGILWSRTFLLTAKSQNQGNSARIVRGTLKFKKPLEIRYHGPLIGNIQKNGLYFVVQSNAQAMFYTSIVTKMRIRFTDP